MMLNTNCFLTMVLSLQTTTVLFAAIGGVDKMRDAYADKHESTTRHSIHGRDNNQGQNDPNTNVFHHGKKKPRVPSSSSTSEQHSVHHFSLGHKTSRSERIQTFAEGQHHQLRPNDNDIDVDKHTRIIGGAEANPGDFPYFVSLNGCGGSLIGPSVVLSAAHCAPNGNELESQTVRVGAFSATEGSEADGSKIVTVNTQINHPSYNDGTLQNDFMLLRLAEPVPLSNMPMLDLSDDISDIADNTPLTVIGLGYTTPAENATPNRLMNVEVFANSDAECINAYGTNPADGVDTSNMFCAGVTGGGKDSCGGDSGGPIVRVVGNEHRQVGVVSWGIDCASAQYPGVYSKIAGNTGYSWIKSVVCDQWQETSSICGNVASPTQPPVPAPTQPPVPAPTQPPVPAPTQPPVPAPTQPPVPVPSPTLQPVTNPTGGSCNAGEILVDVTIELDNFPDETTYEIFNEQGNVVMKGGPYNEEYGTVMESQCVPNTCLVMTLYDSYGDGLFGDYNVDMNGLTVVEGDGVFEYSIDHFFNCGRDVPPTCTPLVLDIVTDVYPEETRLYLIDMTSMDFIWAETQFSAYESRQFTACLDPAKCYNFELYDDYGDGIYPGGVKLTYDGSVVYEGGDFGFGEVFQFGCE